MGINHTTTTTRHMMHEPLLGHVSHLPDRAEELLLENQLHQAECGSSLGEPSGAGESNRPTCLTLAKVPKRNVPKVLSPRKYYSWLTKPLLGDWLQKYPRWFQVVMWEIDYHISVSRFGPSRTAANMVLGKLQPNGPGLCAPAPDAWYRDWFGSLEDRRKAITSFLDPENLNEEPLDKQLYGVSFITPDYGIGTKSLIDVAEEGIADAYSLVAMRRLVDKILNYPSSLQEAKDKQRILRIRTSPDHNHEMASLNTVSKASVYKYNELVQELTKILDHEEYGEAIFRIPSGDLGLKERHESTRAGRKAIIVQSILATTTCLGIVGLLFMKLL